MNFLAHIDNLHQARSAYWRSYLRLNEQLGELETLRSRLAISSGMDSCVDELKRINVSIENELFALGQLTRALERAAEFYPAAEEKVVREWENLNSTKSQRAWGTNDLRSIQKELVEFSLF